MESGESGVSIAAAAVAAAAAARFDLLPREGSRHIVSATQRTALRVSDLIAWGSALPALSSSPTILTTHDDQNSSSN